MAKTCFQKRGANIRHDAAYLWLQSPVVYVGHHFGQKILDIFCGLGCWHATGIRAQTVTAVLPAAESSQLSSPVRIRVKCAEPMVYSNSFASLACLGLCSTTIRRRGGRGM